MMPMCVASLLDLAQQVAGEEDGDPVLLGHAADQLAHFVDARRVQAVRRLVEDQQFGDRQERHGDAEALAHALRVAANGRCASRGESRPTIARARCTWVGVRIDHAPHQLQVLVARQMRIERRAFDQRAHAAQGAQSAARGWVAQAGALHRPGRAEGRAGSGSWWSCRRRSGPGSRRCCPEAPAG